MSLLCTGGLSAETWNPARGAQVASSGECFLQLTAGGMPLEGQFTQVTEEVLEVCGLVRDTEEEKKPEHLL